MARDVRPLGNADRDEALALCAQDPPANVYVAARILETDLDRARGSLLGYQPRDTLESLCWVSANIVPVSCNETAATALRSRLRRRRYLCSSVFGPADQVGYLWASLSADWGPPLDVRARQPLMVLDPDTPVGRAPDPKVRRARADEVELVAPAAQAMFTEEIGYPPYSDTLGQAGYWAGVRSLILRGHTFVLVDNGRVLFKADLGSVGVGACQIQGVWVAPEARGTGLSEPALAAVCEVARAEVAPLVSLYVNDYNTAALASYRRVGFREVGTFATVLV